DLLHHLVARVEDLALVVALVVAVFADEQDALDRQLVAAAGEGVGDGAVNLDAEIPAQFAGQVVFRLLIDIQGADVVFGNVELAAPGVAMDEPAGDVVGVRHRPIDGGKDGDGLSAVLGGFARPGAEPARGGGPLGGRRGHAAAQGQGRGRGQKLAARTTQV